MAFTTDYTTVESRYKEPRYKEFLDIRNARLFSLFFVREIRNSSILESSLGIRSSPMKVPYIEVETRDLHPIFGSEQVT